MEQTDTKITAEIQSDNDGKRRVSGIKFPIVVGMSTPTTFKTILQNHSNVYKNAKMIVSKNKVEFVSTNSGFTLMGTSVMECVCDFDGVYGILINGIRKTWVPAFKRVTKDMAARLFIYENHTNVELVIDSNHITRYKAPCEHMDISKVSVIPYSRVSKPQFIHMVTPISIWKNFINDCRRQCNVKNAFIEVRPQNIILGYRDEYMDRVEEHIVNVRNVVDPTRYVYPVSHLHAAVTSVPKKISCHIVISDQGTLSISYRFPPGKSHIWFAVVSHPKK